jgi:squalene-hopene/tetraprenyl-beta-curcumene cyclase
MDAQWTPRLVWPEVMPPKRKRIREEATAAFRIMSTDLVRHELMPETQPPAHRLAIVDPLADSHDPADPPRTVDTLFSHARRATLRTRDWLAQQQHEDGYWVGELEGDTILESEYILLLAFLGQEQSERAKQAAEYILTQQQDHGGWSLFPGGPLEISGTVKAYWALKLTGHDPSTPAMQRARSAILKHGGADAVNTFTRFYYALLGQIDYRHCPTVPPEFMLFPKWFPINPTRVSAWSRTMIVPLSIMWAKKPVRSLPEHLGIQELFLKKPDDWAWPECPGLKPRSRFLSWRRFFLGVDKCLKWAERRGLMFLRKKALKHCEQWMLDRFEHSEGLGAIFPPMIWSVIALKALGYKDDDPAYVRCLKVVEDLAIDEDNTRRMEPCKSPVWDTAISLIALADAGLPSDDVQVATAQRWLLDRQTTKKGDWADVVKAEPGGWYFEHANEFYPDVDDTIMVLMALGRKFDPPQPDLFPTIEDGENTDREERDTDPDLQDRITDAGLKAERWVLAMQNRDGGWGAFDRDNDCEVLCHVPFADHNAMIDPSTPDLTARVLESLGKRGYRLGDPAVDRAMDYLRRTQEADGSWFGRWGVNYIYGTWQVLMGLEAVGVPSDDPLMRRGAAWLFAHQQSCGGWGETCDSYRDASLRGQGEPTPSQTAWALLGLIAAGHASHPAVQRGIRYLAETQNEDGTWDETEFTGTGFPQVFYLRYHLYRIYFPLMALGRWLRKHPRTVSPELALVSSH